MKKLCFIPFLIYTLSANSTMVAVGETELTPDLADYLGFEFTRENTGECGTETIAIKIKSPKGYARTDTNGATLSFPYNDQTGIRASIDTDSQELDGSFVVTACFQPGLLKFAEIVIRYGPQENPTEKIFISNLKRFFDQ